MNLDLNEIFRNRINVLEQRIESLIQIQNEVKIVNAGQFAVSGIWDSEKKILKGKVGHDNLASIESISGAVVYIFEMVNITDADKKQLIENFTTYRSPKNKDKDGKDLRRASSRIINKADEHRGNILYVGSVKNRIASRVREHLGLGHKQTYSLQLKHWMPLGIVLNLYYICIPNAEITNDVEAAITARLNPLLGKPEK